MRRLNYFPFFLLIVFLLFMMSFPKKTVDKFRNFAIASFSPISHGFKNLLFKAPKIDMANLNSYEIDKLKLENTMLKNQINGIYEWLFFENRIEDQVDRYKIISGIDEKDIYLKEFFQRRAEELKEILKVEYQSIPAKVIFRSASSWSSSLWINVGEKNNQQLSKLIIAKNSPVVLANNLVGVVEYVGQSFSRIRLITDSGLVPSVRAIRGNAQDKALLEVLCSLKDHIYSRDDIFISNEEKSDFLNTVTDLKNKLTKGKEEKYLAKGELQGSSHPFWRSKNTYLKGIGFNYDYADAEGSAKDLRTGVAVYAKDMKSEPLIEKGDLLITTGMDGIFPKGLNVAIVSKVNALKDGDFAYTIEAKPSAENLNDIEIVFVLPPLGFEN